MRELTLRLRSHDLVPDLRALLKLARGEVRGEPYNLCGGAPTGKIATRSDCEVTVILPPDAAAMFERLFDAQPGIIVLTGTAIPVRIPA